MSTNAIINDHSIIKANKTQISCDLQGEAVILDLKEGVYYGLNPVGARIWDLIQQPITMKEITEKLLEEYNVSPKVCQDEVLALLQKLIGQGLAEIENEVPKLKLE